MGSPTHIQGAPSPIWLPVSRGNVTVQVVNVEDFPTLLAHDIAKCLNSAIENRGKAVLSVSGGQSPIAMFEALRVHAIDWSKVTITLVDERCVPNTHPDSNAHLVNTHLLQDGAQAATFVPMVTEDIDMVDAQKQALWASAQLQTNSPADMLVLGMGVDGHTASLFPDAPNLFAALDLHNQQACVGITLPHPPANAPFPRVTQTLAQLLTARHIVLPVMGEDKRHTLQQAWSHPRNALPVSHVLHQTQTPVVLWMAA